MAKLVSVLSIMIAVMVIGVVAVMTGFAVSDNSGPFDCREKVNDLGDNSNVFGIITYHAHDYADYCVNKDYVQEYFCTPGGKLGHRVELCSADYICTKGECRKDVHTYESD